jgi:hypothetical protein
VNWPVSGSWFSDDARFSPAAAVWRNETKGKTQDQPMRLTREKTMRLSHVITDVLVSSQEVEFVEDRDTIRQKTVQILQELLKEEEAVDTEVRKKISSQKKEVLEGSEEWDVLYRKYYAEEMRRMGVVHVPSS